MAEQTPKPIDLSADEFAIPVTNGGVLLGHIDIFEFQGECMRLSESYGDDAKAKDMEIAAKAVRACLPKAELSDAKAYAIAVRLSRSLDALGKG